jgi:S-formylglutathione hydrolase
MKFRVYLPDSTSKLPVLYFLSGLTCNEDNFITKSGAIQYASKYSIALSLKKFISHHKFVLTLHQEV